MSYPVPACRGRIATAPLLLDQISTPATAAYSMRKLRAAYNGSAFRQRRDSDNAESDFGFVGENLNTAAISAWLGGASGYFPTWYDQSGNGYDASQATASKQPLYVDTGSRQEMQPDQTDDNLAVSGPDTTEGSWFFGSQHGFQLSRQALGTNPQLQRLYGIMASVLFGGVLSAGDKSTLTNWATSKGFGAEQYMIASTNDTTIYHSITSPNGPYTITFIGANGTTYTTSANETTDVAAQGLTAPITVLFPVAMLTDAGMTDFRCYDNQLTGSIPDLSADTALVTFYCNSNQLTGYSGSSLPATLTNFLAQNNALSVTAVNNILIHLDNAGAVNGTCNLSSGTNAAPTGAGVTAKNNLIANGWTVTTN